MSHVHFLEHRNLRSNLQKGFSSWGTTSTEPLLGIRPWTQLGDVNHRSFGHRCANPKHANGTE